MFVCVETFPITLETLLESLVCRQARSHLFTLALHCSQWPRHFHGLSRVACRDCYIECPAWQLWLVSPPASGVSCEPSGPHGGPHYTTSHYLTSCQGSIVPVSCLDWYFAPLLVENDARKKYFLKYWDIKIFVQTTFQYIRPWSWQERLFNLAWLLVDTVRRQGDLTLTSQDSTNLPPFSLSLSISLSLSLLKLITSRLNGDIAECFS